MVAGTYIPLRRTFNQTLSHYNTTQVHFSSIGKFIHNIVIKRMYIYALLYDRKKKRTKKCSICIVQKEDRVIFTPHPVLCMHLQSS